MTDKTETTGSADAAGKADAADAAGKAGASGTGSASGASGAGGAGAKGDAAGKDAPGGRHGKPDPFGAELESLRSEVEDRTKDLQRLTAEYANYRRRVERDRALAAEQATGGVLVELLGVLDDIDRARDHGDLVGPFGAVAEQLISVLTKLGLAPFAESGDPFDPNRHEAVAHSLSSEVSEPTCVQVFRRGYQFGERLLRPALVAVADPTDEEPEAATVETAAATKADAGPAGTGAEARPTAKGAETGPAGKDTETDDDEAETVEVETVEAEVVEGEVVDPEAAAVAGEADDGGADDAADDTDGEDDAEDDRSPDAPRKDS